MNMTIYYLVKNTIEPDNVQYIAGPFSSFSDAWEYKHRLRYTMTEEQLNHIQYAEHNITNLTIYN